MARHRTVRAKATFFIKEENRIIRNRVSHRVRKRNVAFNNRCSVRSRELYDKGDNSQNNNSNHVANDGRLMFLFHWKGIEKASNIAGIRPFLFKWGSFSFSFWSQQCSQRPRSPIWMLIRIAPTSSPIPMLWWNITRLYAIYIRYHVVVPSLQASWAHLWSSRRGTDEKVSTGGICPSGCEWQSPNWKTGKALWCPGYPIFQERKASSLRGKDG